MQGFHRQVKGRCPCGAPGASCGPPSTSVPFDRIEEAAMGGPLRKYRVTTGSGVETVMKLNPADAERLGGVPLDGEPLEEPPAGPEAEAPAKRRAAAPNKARRGAENKGGGGGSG